jgi:O-succinylbenzoic acid--CoA ligase
LSKRKPGHRPAWHIQPLDHSHMTDPLSILAAAREAGDRPGLLVGGQVYTFADLARMTREAMDRLDVAASAGMPHALVGSNTLETVITLYALLERRIPALLVHPQLTMPERSDLFAAAARAGPVPHPDAAAVLFTSGTTGEARGAVLTRRSFVASGRAVGANLGWLPDDCWLLCMSLARVGGLSILTRSLAARRSVALFAAFDADLFPRWVIEQRATLASLVPTMLTRVLDAHPDWTPPPHLRAILLGGAAASPRLLVRAEERRLPIVVTYGLTETCTHVTATPYAARFEAADWCAGVPLEGVGVRVTEGRIEVRGDVLMAGYWDAPALARDDWFDTGDLGEFDARGCLSIHARRADLIVTGGENAYPAEVERALEAFPGIAAAGVFGVPDEVWGHTVAAALVAEKVPPSDAELIDYLTRRLAPHKRPRHVCYVQGLPQTPAGKLDRRRLAEMARALRPLSSRLVV